MSIGTHHRRQNRAHPERLKALCSETSYQYMWTRPFKLIAAKDVPDSAGYNVKGDRFYIDRDFFAAVETGSALSTEGLLRVTVTGMSAKQIFEAIQIHERTEKSLLDADNSIVAFEEAHEFATLAEHTYVRSLGVTPKAYEDGIEHIIKYNQRKALKDVPVDLDCSPYLDDPDEQDQMILAMLRRQYVGDAHKKSKRLANFRRGGSYVSRCDGCAHWGGQPSSLLSVCEIVQGSIRNDCVCLHYLSNSEKARQEQNREARNRFDVFEGRSTMKSQGGPPEPLTTKLIRFGLTNWLFWIVVSTWIAAVGFLFIDRYVPAMGVVWNIIHGTINGYSYRGLLAIAAALFLFGCFIGARK